MSLVQPVLLTQRPVQPRGSRLARACLRLAGWTLDFDGLPGKQGVLIVYPHTSNWDFIVGILAKWGMGLSVTFWGKESLFRVPLLGPWMRWLGGVPVDRKASHGIVGQMVDSMRRSRETDSLNWLVLAPEGTRARTPGWRSGFYQVAVGAGVPLGLAYLDFGRRRVGVLHYLQLSGDRRLDMAAVAQQLDGVTGCRPELAAPIQLKES